MLQTTGCPVKSESLITGEILTVMSFRWPVAVMTDQFHLTSYNVRDRMEKIFHERSTTRWPVEPSKEAQLNYLLTIYTL